MLFRVFNKVSICIQIINLNEMVLKRNFSIITNFYIKGKHWKRLKAACKRYWNRKIRREDAYNDTHIKIGKRHFSGEDFGGI